MKRPTIKVQIPVFMRRPIIVKVQIPFFPPGATEALVYDQRRSFKFVIDTAALPPHVMRPLTRYPKAYFLASLTKEPGTPIIFHKHVGDRPW